MPALRNSLFASNPATFIPSTSPIFGALVSAALVVGCSGSDPNTMANEGTTSGVATSSDDGTTSTGGGTTGSGGIGAASGGQGPGAGGTAETGASGGATNNSGGGTSTTGGSGGSGSTDSGP